MVERKCPYCPKILPSEKRYNQHLVFEHEAFEQGECIGLATLRSLERTQDKVHFLLLKYKEARSPHDWPLFKQYVKWFSPGHLIVWDAGSGKYTSNPREGWDENQIRMLFIELDTVSRARRKLQAKDKAVWHKLASSVPPHHCILPTEEAMVQAKLVEEAYKSWAVRL